MRQTKSKIIISNLQEIAHHENYSIRKPISTIIQDNEWYTSHSNELKEFSIITLFSQKSFEEKINLNEIVMILPLVGSIEIAYSKYSNFIENGSVRFMNKVGELQFKNPYPSETIQFIFIKISNDLQKLPRTKSNRFELEDNQFAKIFTDKSLNISLHIGKFDARIDGIFKLKSEHNLTYIFNISGVFEVDNKLLETSDFLILKDIDGFEFESLTNQSVLLIFEF